MSTFVLAATLALSAGCVSGQADVSFDFDQFGRLGDNSFLRFGIDGYDNHTVGNYR